MFYHKNKLSCLKLILRVNGGQPTDTWAQAPEARHCNRPGGRTSAPIKSGEMETYVSTPRVTRSLTRSNS